MLKILGIFLILLPFAVIGLYRFVPPPLTPGMVSSTLHGRPLHYKFVPIARISRHMPAAVVMSEDNRYCSHWGVDWTAVQQVLHEVERGRKIRGASTITMQTARGLFLWQGRSYIRKALEVPLATLMSVMLPKRRVMELYLNIAEWGPGIYGIEAASLRYFGKSAARLSRWESALLAATLPRPSRRRPNRPSRYMNKTAKIISARIRRSRAYTRCLRR